MVSPPAKPGVYLSELIFISFIAVALRPVGGVGKATGGLVVAETIDEPTLSLDPLSGVTRK